MKVKSIFSKNNRSLFLSIVAITYLVLMFIIWNVNIFDLLINSRQIFIYMNIVFGIALLLNIDRVFIEKRIKTILIYVLIMIILLFNIFNIF